MTDGGDELHGPLVIRASLDNFAEGCHQDFAGDSEDRRMLAVSKSESGDLHHGLRSSFTARDERL